MKTTFFTNNFLLCGALGWCLEIFWTGLHSMQKGKKDLMGQSSLWMFPIYGCASVIAPLSRIYKNCSRFVRGCIYMLHIFAGEYIFGCLLKKYEMCPWDYSKSKFHVNGVIRLDYAPLWFITGLFYENLLNKTKMNSP